jgi:tubulin epsilon
MKQLTDHADCVIPIDNQSLVNIVNKVESVCHPTSSNGSNSSSFASSFRKADPSKIIANNNQSTIISSANSTTAQKKCEKPFDSMNNIVANMLLNLTSSSRFEGSLNVDLNEITMNLVPVIINSNFIFTKIFYSSYFLVSKVTLFAIFIISFVYKRTSKFTGKRH